MPRLGHRARRKQRLEQTRVLPQAGIVEVVGSFRRICIQCFARLVGQESHESLYTV